jgi:hypothetical protein
MDVSRSVDSYKDTIQKYFFVFLGLFKNSLIWFRFLILIVVCIFTLLD